MTRLISLVCVAAPIVAGLAFACAATTNAACSNPIQDACTAKAQAALRSSPKIAAEHGVTTDEMSTEFVTACVGQLQNDLDQTLAALDTIVDAGAQAKKGNK